MTRFASLGKDYSKIDVSEAMSLIQQSISRNTLDSETLLSSNCFGRILAFDVKSAVNIPMKPASIVDGFAVCISSDDHRYLIVGQTLAGDSDSVHFLSPGQAIYVTTGGYVPNGATCVIPIEQCIFTNSHLTFSSEANFHAGTNIRSIGSDTCIGSVVLLANSIIGPTEMALLAGCKVEEVSVFKKLRIGIVSTGAEILSEEVGDVNRTYLLSRLCDCSDISVTVNDFGVIADEMASFIDILKSSNWDILITTGGLSKGKTDYWRPALEKLEYEILFGQLDLKPGKPTTVARKITGEHIFCLPGNPASCFVTFNLLVLPIITKKPVQTVQVYVETLISPDLERPEFARATVSFENGVFKASLADGHQRSSRIASCVGVNALVKIPPGRMPLSGGYFDCFLLEPNTLITNLRNESSETVPMMAKAAAFDKLVEWLKTRTEVENISLMNLVGFCRNCLAKWLPVPLQEAQKYIYGMDYTVWKSLYRKGEKLEHEVVKSNQCASSISTRSGVPLFVMTISDRAHAKIYDDLSGPKIVQMIPMCTVVDRVIVPDEKNRIAKQISVWVKTFDNKSSGLIVTSGGTGLGQRDVTREAILPLIEKHAIGLEQYLSNTYSATNPLFALSNPTIGTIGKLLVVCLPGRPEAVEQGLTTLLPLIPKILDELDK